MQALRKGEHNDEFTFELYDYDDDGNVIYVPYEGCYVIFDNGYLKWSVTIPPMKR